MTLWVDKKPGILKTNNMEQKVSDTNMAQAFVIIHCSKSDEFEILQNFEEIPEVIEVDMLVENYKTICNIADPTHNDISEIVIKKIRKIAWIKSTTTINIINNQGFSR